MLNPRFWLSECGTTYSFTRLEFEVHGPVKCLVLVAFKWWSFIECGFRGLSGGISRGDAATAGLSPLVNNKLSLTCLLIFSPFSVPSTLV
jgi:hypothetical protein